MSYIHTSVYKIARSFIISFLKQDILVLFCARKTARMVVLSLFRNAIW